MNDEKRNFSLDFKFIGQITFFGDNLLTFRCNGMNDNANFKTEARMQEGQETC